MLQKARAGEAPVTCDVTPCDKLSQKAKEIEQLVLTQGAVLHSAWSCKNGEEARTLIL